MSGRDRTGVPLPAGTANNAGAGDCGIGTPREASPAPVLTRTQQRILTMIREYVRERGYPPSMREIGDATGLASTSSVAHQIGVLERNGYIRRDQRRSRAYVVLDPDGAP